MVFGRTETLACRELSIWYIAISDISCIVWQISAWAAHFFSSPSVCHFYKDMNVLTNKFLSTLTHSSLTSLAKANYRIIHFLFQRDETVKECDKCWTPLNFYTESNPSAGVNPYSSTCFTTHLQPHQLGIYHMLFKEHFFDSVLMWKKGGVLNTLDDFFFLVQSRQTETSVNKILVSISTRNIASTAV